MPLTMRPTGLASPGDKDRQDVTVYCGEWAVGRIYEQRGGPDSMRWFWSLHGIFGKPAACTPTATQQRSTGPRAQFESTWRQWLAWAKLREDT